MKISKNFSYRELIRSQTADRLGLENKPNEEQLINLVHLTVNVLQPVRDTHGIVTVSSGFRDPVVSEKVGSSSKSQHCQGQAADFECLSGPSNYDLAQWIRDNLEFDQLILEMYRTGDPHSGWVHCSYNLLSNRKKCLTASIVDGSTKYDEGLNV